MNACGMAMLRNEEVFCGFNILEMLAALERVIVMDTGSTDDTVKIIEGIGQEHAELGHDERIQWGERELHSREYGKLTLITTDQPLTQEENGDIMNYMASIADAEWWMGCDGDEYYPRSALKEIIAFEMPPEVRLGYIELQLVRHHEGRWRYGDEWHGQKLHYIPGIQWVNKYPDVCPNWHLSALEGEPLTIYIPTDSGEILDFHHAIRSRKDDETPHRKLHPLGRRRETALREETQLPFEWKDEWWTPYRREE